jgi:hypothetical protein
MKPQQMIVFLTFLALVLMSGSSYAATILPYHDDFQDGSLLGWSATNTGGTGSTGVDLEPGIANDPNNLAAWAYHIGTGTEALTQDFNFAPNAILSFDMLTLATQTTGTLVYNAWSGVKITFLDSLNTDLGNISFFYGTDSTGNVPDQNWHSYLASMNQLTALAGTNLIDPTKMSLSFWATGTNGNVGDSHAKVWFDNVNLTTVPVPPAVWLLGSGLVGLVGIGRRKKAA